MKKMKAEPQSTPVSRVFGYKGACAFVPLRPGDVTASRSCSTMLIASDPTWVYAEGADLHSSQLTQQGNPMTCKQISLGLRIVTCITMFAALSPTARTAEQIDIGSRRELFVDRHLIDKMDGVHLELHRRAAARGGDGV